MEDLIERALQKAKYARDGELGFTTADTVDGMVYKIWYRTVGADNVLVRYEVVTSEAWDWEKHGCSNNEEWRRYLNKCFWKAL